jgi:hypothetical protein
MDVIKKWIFNEKQKEKSVYADGDLLVFSVMRAASSGILHMS